jgi:membrane associated rhomboid family serine protease
MQTKTFPIVTISIIVLNSIIFAVGLLSGEQTQIIRNYGFIPNQLFNPEHGLLSEPQSLSIDSLTRLFTSIFIHSNFIHIAFNMFALAYLGVYAERAIGVTRYILVYVVSGIIAALFHGVIASYILHNGNVILIGASGAISGVFGIAAVAGNRSAYYWLFLQIVFAIIGSVSALPIAFTAHVSGFIAGVVITKVVINIERARKKSSYSLQP